MYRIRKVDPSQDPIDRIVEAVIYLQAESRRLAKEQCARHGITATQLNVLKLLQEIGELSLSELSRRMAARNSTLTGIIDRMVAAELVTREQSDEDRRVWRIQLTPRGRAIAETIEVAPWNLLRSALRALPDAERGVLIALLTKLAGHVEEAVAAAEGDSE
jgi:DNA-binding MarR family transcriptional regulator